MSLKFSKTVQVMCCLKKGGPPSKPKNFNVLIEKSTVKERWNRICGFEINSEI